MPLLPRSLRKAFKLLPAKFKGDIKASTKFAPSLQEVPVNTTASTRAIEYDCCVIMNPQLLDYSFKADASWLMSLNPSKEWHKKTRQPSAVKKLLSKCSTKSTKREMRKKKPNSVYHTNLQNDEETWGWFVELTVSQASHNYPIPRTRVEEFLLEEDQKSIAMQKKREEREASKAKKTKLREKKEILNRDYEIAIEPLSNHPSEERSPRRPPPVVSHISNVEAKHRLSAPPDSPSGPYDHVSCFLHEDERKEKCAVVSVSDRISTSIFDQDVADLPVDAGQSRERQRSKVDKFSSQKQAFADAEAGLAGYVDMPSPPITCICKSVVPKAGRGKYINSVLRHWFGPNGKDAKNNQTTNERVAQPYDWVVPFSRITTRHSWMRNLLPTKLE